MSDIFFFGLIVGVIFCIFGEWRWEMITNLLKDLEGREDEHDSY